MQLLAYLALLVDPTAAAWEPGEEARSLTRALACDQLEFEQATECLFRQRRGVNICHAGCALPAGSAGGRDSGPLWGISKRGIARDGFSRHPGGIACPVRLPSSSNSTLRPHPRRYLMPGVSDPQQPSGESAARELIESAGARLPQEGGGSVRTALANAMVGLKKQFYGRGPTAAKAWILDDYVFVAMEDGLTRNEETLLADGKEDLVRGYRLSFQETMGETTTAAVEELLGRRVLTYQSQIVFDPPRTFEIFVLEPPSQQQ
jgi:uncharacterized protein YbcI